VIDALELKLIPFDRDLPLVAPKQQAREEGP
jgi:hypothetical protein